MIDDNSGHRIKMIRPNWDELVQAVAGLVYISCSCGATLHTYEATREHWQLGHFDYQLGICCWTLVDEWSDMSWETTCGNKFVFFDEGPEENSFAFCPYCGKKLKVEA